jgi:hypothetical protein
MSKKLSNTMVTSGMLKAVVQPLMAVRDIDLSYNIENITTIAGYTQKPRYFGIDFNESEHLDPGFVLECSQEYHCLRHQISMHAGDG